jgi:hypothetical protein
MVLFWAFHRDHSDNVLCPVLSSLYWVFLGGVQKKEVKKERIREIAAWQHHCRLLSHILRAYNINKLLFSAT